MCSAIGEILKRCPKAYYAPIGEVQNPDRIRLLLEPYHVNDRVLFLGVQADPSQYARSMHLYLNEFPFGSGLAMLEAMAAGCPVVSMYDPAGPPQATYGGAYFGFDRVIKTGNRQDYIDLTCRLLQDPVFYQKWSEHALNQYEKHADVKTYVQSFENILLRK